MKIGFKSSFFVPVACLVLAAPAALADDDGPPSDASVRVHWARGEKPAKPGGGGGSPLMTWHGGSIMTTAVTQSIFWGPKWGNASFYGDKIAGLDSFYQGFGNSNYSKTSDEYTGTNGQVGA